MDIGYSIEFSLELGFDKVEQTVRDTLAGHGFGILTEIDVKATMKKKLDIDYLPYKILGACNPKYADMALTGEPDIGLLLPCNVIVYQTKTNKIRVVVTKASSVFELVDNPDVKHVADDVDKILLTVLNEVTQNLS